MKMKYSAKGKRPATTTNIVNQQVSANVDDLLLVALEGGGDASKTGRFLVTFKEGAAEAGLQSLQSQSGMRVVDAREFANQAVDLAQTGDADAVVFPEIGVALLGSSAAAERGMTAETAIAEDSPISSVDPEYFVFAAGVDPNDYLRGFMRAAQTIYADLGTQEPAEQAEVEPAVLGVTWGLTACRVPPSSFNGNGIKVAVLDTGFDLGHPEFAGRAVTTNTFVGQPVQDLHGHGTHCIGTACGPQTPAGFVPRYGIGFRTQIFAGKVLSNAGGGTQAQSLAGINWAVANRCQVISMSLRALAPPQPSYTAAGSAALSAGCLIIAAAGNDSNRPGLIVPTGAPANSPTVMAVGAVDSAMRIASFSNGGKIEIAGPGVNVYSAWPRPNLHRTISGTSMSTPHVAGCAALWAQSNPALRGAALRARLISSARALPLPASTVGAGLVQAP